MRDRREPRRVLNYLPNEATFFSSSKVPAFLLMAHSPAPAGLVAEQGEQRLLA